MVMGPDNKSPGTGPAQNAGNSGIPVLVVPATPGTVSRVSGLEASLGLLRTDMVSMFGQMLEKFSRQSEQPRLPGLPADPRGAPDQGRGLLSPDSVVIRPGSSGRAFIGGNMSPDMGQSAAGPATSMDPAVMGAGLRAGPGLHPPPVSRTPTGSGSVCLWLVRVPVLGHWTNIHRPALRVPPGFFMQKSPEPLPAVHWWVFKTLQ